MFKFMKSKKGFTLVELMIVVVIMAILVAVAVPIYNAVTENARKKTCATNRRNIISQITNNVMSDPTILASTWTTNDSATFTVTTDGEGKAISDVSDGVKKVLTDADTFKNLFSTDNKPICPVAGGVLSVTVTSGAADKTSLDVVVDCTGVDHDENAKTNNTPEGGEQA